MKRIYTCLLFLFFQLYVKAQNCNLTLQADSTTCSYTSDGKITVMPTGGTGLYSITWSPNPSGSSLISGSISPQIDTIINLPGAIPATCYTVTVTDQSGCTATALACIKTPVPISVTIAIAPPIG